MAQLDQLIRQHLADEPDLLVRHELIVIGFDREHRKENLTPVALREAFVNEVAREYSRIDEVGAAVATLDATPTVSLRDESGTDSPMCACGGYMLSIGGGYCVCDECGHVSAQSADALATVAFGTAVEHGRYPYRRTHHFNEWLTQLQGRESTRIPPADMEAITLQIQKERIREGALDPKNLRAVLKTLRLQKLYEHIPNLLFRLQGTLPPQLPHDLETRFIRMFATVQAPFDRARLVVCPDRKNFLSYSYVLSKFCGICGRHDLKRHFPLLKSRDKLMLHDRVWRLVCDDEEVRWPYEPSV